MTYDEFDKHLDNIFAPLRKIGATKGKEYAGTDDRLANFKRLAERLRVTPETVCLIYGTKHLDSIASYVAAVEDCPTRTPPSSEPIQGRFHDAILYLALLSALLAERDAAEVAEARHQIKESQP